MRHISYLKVFVKQLLYYLHSYFCAMFSPWQCYLVDMVVTTEARRHDRVARPGQPGAAPHSPGSRWVTAAGQLRGKQSANQSGHKLVEFYSIFHFSQEFVKIVNILKIFYTPFEFPDSSNILLNFVDI